MALLALEANPSLEVCALVTTLNESTARVSMHGLRESLLDTQAQTIGLPLVKCGLPANAGNDLYRRRFAAALAPLIDDGVSGVAFGDLFLAEVRSFREAQMQALRLEALFPLWGTPSATLARLFLQSGHRAILGCVDATRLGPRFLGRDYDAKLLAELPVAVDPCGENGEFHSFVHAGPRLVRNIRFRRGRRVVHAQRFHFLDLLAEPPARAAV